MQAHPQSAVDAEEVAEALVAATLAPLRAVGELLAGEVDKVNADIAALRDEVHTFGMKVEVLERLLAEVSIRAEEAAFYATRGTTPEAHHRDELGSRRADS